MTTYDFSTVIDGWTEDTFTSFVVKGNIPSVVVGDTVLNVDNSEELSALSIEMFADVTVTVGDLEYIF